MASLRLNSSRINAANPFPVKRAEPSAHLLDHHQPDGHQQHHEQGPVLELRSGRCVRDDPAGVVAGVGGDDARAEYRQVDQPARRRRGGADRPTFAKVAMPDRFPGLDLERHERNRGKRRRPRSGIKASTRSSARILPTGLF